MKAWQNHPNIHDDELVKPRDDNSAINSDARHMADTSARVGSVRAVRQGSQNFTRQAANMFGSADRAVDDSATGDRAADISGDAADIVVPADVKIGDTQVADHTIGADAAEEVLIVGR
jgi:hypothetical protein